MFPSIYFEGGGGRCGTIGIAMYLFGGILVGKSCCCVVILGRDCVEVF